MSHTVTLDGGLLEGAYRNLAPAPTSSSTNVQAPAKARFYKPRTYTKRTRLRFERDRTVELIRHLGREPSYPERIIIARCVGIEWELRRLDAKIDSGDELSGHALRARLAGENRLRLDLQALGLRPAAAKPPTLADLFPGRDAVA
jgi:hypothetical protein